MRSSLFLLIGVAIVLAVIAIIVFNGMVRRRNMVRNAFSTIDVNLRKRHDLIPNLVETVRAFAKHEEATFTALTEARARAQSGGLSDGERLRVEGQIGPQVTRILAVAEAYPELRSSEHFLNLQRNLTEIEEQISAARRAYNAAVFENNNGVESFPGVLFAQSCGFQRQDFFEADASAREPSDVNF